MTTCRGADHDISQFLQERQGKKRTYKFVDAILESSHDRDLRRRQTRNKLRLKERLTILGDTLVHRSVNSAVERHRERVAVDLATIRFGLTDPSVPTFEIGQLCTLRLDVLEGVLDGADLDEADLDDLGTTEDGRE